MKSESAPLPPVNFLAPQLLCLCNPPPFNHLSPFPTKPLSTPSHSWNPLGKTAPQLTPRHPQNVNPTNPMLLPQLLPRLLRHHTRESPQSGRKLLPARILKAANGQGSGSRKNWISRRQQRDCVVGPGETIAGGRG